VVLPFDLHEDLIGVADAAALAGVSESAIRQWKRRGHLKPAGLDEFGRPMFTGVAVLRAEAKTRKSARRRQAVVS
jgi:DNA-binding transcriptional MerR regulator